MALCSLCNTKLGFLKSPKLKDGGQLCMKCMAYMNDAFGTIIFKGSQYTLDEVKQAAMNFEEKKHQRKETSNIIAPLIEGKKSYDIKYKGGFADVEEAKVSICAISEGIIAYIETPAPEIGFFKFIFEKKFLLPWPQIVKIDYISEASGNSAAKAALTTAGLLKGNNLMLAAGIASKTMNHRLIVTLKDNTGFESNVVFETSQAQEIALHLTGQRQILYASKQG